MFHVHLDANPPSSTLKAVRELSCWLHFVYISLELDHDLQQGCWRALTAGLSYLLLISKNLPKQPVQVCSNSSGVVEICAQTEYLEGKKEENLEAKIQEGWSLEILSLMIISQHVCVYMLLITGLYVFYYER